ncbi:hypothetical protein BAG01nite_49600 [Brevibacillus agri]|uniref:Uncharacterized protein n=1 Tax=Brevibacillus agri TaxID=51101 RepID=A0A3M8A2S6_9BACL|nr:hypothetical protein [Brevibacillus agri]MDT7986084.1 hypothetical protein [Clostridium perfringens]QAV14867.1 hypothetical protein BA6348_20090 [Brevibacillus agri]RNB45281.1 hypothetical protein EB820_25780 [Brevibacillus agri]GED28858.1 hypothetical protein BAG01nite_49600 [Brevibacillus agri]
MAKQVQEVEEKVGLIAKAEAEYEAIVEEVRNYYSHNINRIIIILGGLPISERSPLRINCGSWTKNTDLSPGNIVSFS